MREHLHNQPRKIALSSYTRVASFFLIFSMLSKSSLTLGFSAAATGFFWEKEILKKTALCDHASINSLITSAGGWGLGSSFLGSTFFGSSFFGSSFLGAGAATATGAGAGLDTTGAGVATGAGVEAGTGFGATATPFVVENKKEEKGGRVKLKRI